MSSNFIDASSVSVQKQEERESEKAKVKADVAIVVPMDVAPDARFDLDYDGITKAINDFVERQTIDPRVSKIEYELSTPELPDKNATDNLKGTLTGNKSKVETPEEVVKVDNDAIKDDKVTLKFELSVEETVILDETDNAKNNQQKQSPKPETTDHKAQNPEKSKAATEKTKQQINNNQSKGDLYIQSAEPKLYIQSAPTKQLYWENAPQKNLEMRAVPENNDILDNAGLKNNNRIEDEDVSTIRTSGDVIDSAMDPLTSHKYDSAEVKKVKQSIKVRSKGGKWWNLTDNVYNNPKFKGNQYVKMVALSDTKAVKVLGRIGKPINYGAVLVQTGYNLRGTSTWRERGEIIGEGIGKVSTGMVAGSVAYAVTTAVLISIVGTAAAPATLIIIAGCAIVSSIVVSNVVEEHGGDLGKRIGTEVLQGFDQ